VPLAVAIDRNAYAEDRGELERAALQAAVVVSPDYLSGDPAELPEVELPIEMGLYTVDGDRVAGDGPAWLESDAMAAAAGRVIAGSTESALVEAVPVAVGEKVIGIVRASSLSRSARSPTPPPSRELATTRCVRRSAGSPRSTRPGTRSRPPPVFAWCRGGRPPGPMGVAGPTAGRWPPTVESKD
jgi:hypothetical protein